MKEDGLKIRHRKSIVEILSANPRVERAVLFGSRAMGTFTATSDVDIALFGDELTVTDQARLMGEIDELTVPQRVDLVLYKTIKNEKLLRHIEVHGVEWYRRGLRRGDEWQRGPISELCELIVDCVNKTAPKVENETPFKMIRTTNVRDGRIDLTECKYVSKETYEKWTARSKVQKGDVILTREAPIGEVGRVETDDTLFLGQRLMQYRADSNVLDSRFLLYSFLSPFLKHQFYMHEGSGSVVSHIKVPDCSKFEIIFPPLFEQKAIAHILGSLDDRIELNSRMKQTLEAMAQALFKSWFVHFDPVIDNALANGKEIPEELAEKASARAALGDKRWTLPEDIRALFPDEFQYSEEMGWIPEGWGAKPIDNALEINPRVRLQKGEIAKFVDMKALPTSGFSVSEIITKPYSGGAKFNKGDVLLARITPCLENGKTGVVDFLNDDEVGFGSTEFIVLRGKGAIHTPFVACLARDNRFRAHCIQSMVGSSGRQRVQNACFSYFYLALPSHNDLLTAFNGLTEGVFEKYLQQRKQSKVLSELRDFLLPKLLSGELRIPDAEKMVEELAL